MKTGIFIPYYNDGPYIQELLDSIDHPCEVVIVNDATPYPDAQHKLRELEAGGYTVLHQPRNRGYAAACNRGIEWLLENTTVDYLTTIGADDAFESRWLGTAERIMDQNPQIGLASGVCLFLHNRQPCFFPPGRFGLDVNETALGGATLMRRKVFARLRYDEELRGYEDWDFYNRCLLEGFSIHAINQPALLWRKKAAGDSLQAKADAMRGTLLAYLRAKYAMQYPGRSTPPAPPPVSESWSSHLGPL